MTVATHVKRALDALPESSAALALELAAVLPPWQLGLYEPGSTTLTQKGSDEVRDALLIGLLALGERLKSGAELERGDEIVILASALRTMEQQ